MRLRLRHRVLDLVLVALSPFAAPFLYLAGRYRWSLRLSRRVQDAIGVTVVSNHYYEPVFTDRDIRLACDDVRLLPGVDLNLPGQLATLERFDLADELAALDGGAVGQRTYRYANNMFNEGDADALYSFIRVFKPRTLIEIGCGQSSIVAQLALRKNLADDPACTARHICFEPFHNGWLKDIGADFRPERIETADLSLFKTLQPNDIVFIDSTHVVRAQGDVECEFLRLLPLLPVGVLVHIHDIFTPRDYQDSFMKNDRRFWTEQYMLEAFLSFNSSYEVVLALNDLHKRQEPKLYDAFPILRSRLDVNPASFGIRRRA